MLRLCTRWSSFPRITNFESVLFGEQLGWQILSTFMRKKTSDVRDEFLTVKIQYLFLSVRYLIISSSKSLKLEI